MTRRWGAEAAPAFDPATRGVLRLVGGPGTGKTSLLIDAAAARVSGGADPQSVLLLVGSGRVGIRTRSALTSTILAGQPLRGADRPAAISEPLVRTVHGYAFAVLRLAAQRVGDPPPRLVTSAEQDAIIRELLAGDGPQAWPTSLHAAVRTDGFATELRNLLARCAERGIDAAQLAQWGRRSGRPEWAAAARFARQYEQVMLLRAAVGRAAPQATVPALGAADLVGAALDAFGADPTLLAGERERIRVLLVDDAQQLDPQAARLVQVLAAGTGLSLFAGDPNQAVFGFRGADPGGLLAGDSPAITLTASHRCAPAVAGAVNAVADRLPGPRTVRHIEGTGVGAGMVTVRSAASRHAEAALIADTLRRAHLVDGVPWSQMAVLVRSVARAGSGLPRTLAAAGVPVLLPSSSGALAEQPAVAALLTVLTATADGLDGECALELLTGPIGRVDPVSLRQLRRLVCHGETDRPGDLGNHLAAMLSGEVDRLPAGYARPLRRLRAVLDVAARCHRQGRDPHYTLWQAWDRCGLQQRWLALIDRGGSAGAQADRDLDAVTALFEVAEQYVARVSGASLRGLVEHITAMRLTTPGTESAPETEAVSILSVHAALDQEWDLVVIAGLQEGLWPNTVPRGGVLHTQRLLDLVDGIGAEASARAFLLAEERRLLVAALGRARRRLLITAVDGDADGDGPEQIPSRFFAELARVGSDDVELALAPVSVTPVLSAAAVVGRLRSVVCAPPGVVADCERAAAATQLARLAQAKVPGADPMQWYGRPPVSTDATLGSPGQPITVSPSSLQTLIDCPLRWLVERHGAARRGDLRSAVGSMLHALIAGPDNSETELLAALDRVWSDLPFESQWYSANELARHRAMLQTFMQWRRQTREQLSEVGAEMAVDGAVGVSGVRLRGRIDRVERDADGRLVVVDVKTGKSPVSKAEAKRHAQLATYQLAVDAGLIAEGQELGGARLVYLGKPEAGGPAERQQDPLTAEAREEWRGVIAQAVAEAHGPQFIARVNDGCRHCPIRSSCPARTQGPLQDGAQ